MLPQSAPLRPSRVRATLCAIMAILVLHGCGFKGDLYLPEDGDATKSGKPHKAPPQ